MTFENGPDTHSQMEHYFFSYLLTCEVDFFENSAIVAVKSDILTFIHVKSIKVTTGFNLRMMKKVRQMALSCRKKQKQIVKLLYLNYGSATRGPRGVKKCPRIH